MKLQTIVVMVGFVVGLTGASVGAELAGLGGKSALAQERSKKKKKAKKKSKAAIHRCVDYSQDQEDEGMRIDLANGCGMDLTCSMSWEVICSSDTSDVVRKKATVFSLAEDTSNGSYASAAMCGDDGWRIRDVRWSCEDEEL